MVVIFPCMKVLKTYSRVDIHCDPAVEVRLWELQAFCLSCIDTQVQQTGTGNKIGVARVLHRNPAPVPGFCRRCEDLCWAEDTRARGALWME